LFGKFKYRREKVMKFEYKNFSCDVDLFRNGDDLLVKFFDASKEQKEEEIHDLVFVDPGFGYLFLKYKGDGGLLGGFLDEDVFSTDELVNAAINFLESLSPMSNICYVPHHVERIKRTSYVEYNGEY
jgi:hypothetical protein